jgi:ribose 1,5-bisphosphokinase
MKKAKGQLFLIVGNSGSGKDSLIKEALKDWPPNAKKIHIPQRYITRPPHETEPFISVKPEEFVKLKTENKFCITWHIYELDYGVPMEICDILKNGENVLINVSRNIIPEARLKFPGVKVIFVYVPFEITSARLKNRGRESEDNPIFKERIERAKENQNLSDADFVVDNSGALEIGAKKLREYLLQFSIK